MSLIAQDTTTNPLVKYMTYNNATGQQAQIGMMSGWLTDWVLNQTDTGQTRMAWMTGPAVRRTVPVPRAHGPAPAGTPEPGPPPADPVARPTHRPARGLS